MKWQILHRAPPPEPVQATNTDYVGTLRQMVTEENRLRNDRIAWLNTIQGLLFAALGFAWKDGRQLIPVLAFLGIFVAISSWLGLIVSHVALSKLKAKWEKWKDNEKDKDLQRYTRFGGVSPPRSAHPDIVDVFGHWAPMSHVWPLFAPWFFLPVLFALAWGWILFLHFSSPARDTSALVKTVCLTVNGEPVELTGGTLTTIRPGTTIGTCP